MINKKNLVLATFVFAIFSVYCLTLISAQNTYCAERTLSGAWCQNVHLEEVDTSYRYVPASCEATSYCKMGTCVNTFEGTCLENTPQKVCAEPDGEEAGGVWFNQPQEDIPQCQLGCCILGDQAAFVTQVRCEKLSSDYGLETNYRTDIQTEVACISSVSSQDKGACVYEEDFQRTCRFLTQNECQTISTGNTNLSVEFHEGILCSAEILNTTCGYSEKTTIVDGKDEIYFVDTCGNIANIYDFSKKEDSNYWSEVVGKAESCGFNNGNAGSATCGNCDYFLGSTGKMYDRTLDSTRPELGDYICRDLSCEYQGEVYQHGETWCATSSGNDKNLPGDRHFRKVCYDSEVTVEPCSDFRQEICIQDDINGFSTAACRVNQWQDCTSQDTKDNCENTDARDCRWIEGERFDGEETEDSDRIGSCVPKYQPGFNFWQAESDAESLCLLANKECIVTYEKGLLDGGWDCVDNCECLEDSWAGEQNNLCLALGDCGSITNFVGKQGFNEIDDLYELVDNEDLEDDSSSGTTDTQQSAFSGG